MSSYNLQSFIWRLYIISIGLFQFATAQTVYNGQIFTNALAIVDSPAMYSTMHTGSPLTLAIDVSGDGQLSQAASTPNSGLPTSFQLLEVYLTSASLQLNLTVSSGPGLLTQEPGSTVKHINWQIPDCVQTSSYNITIYETSLIQGVEYFSITPIPIQIQNAAGSTGACTTGVNPSQPLPQPDNHPSVNPLTILQAGQTRTAVAGQSAATAFPAGVSSGASGSGSGDGLGGTIVENYGTVTSTYTIATMTSPVTRTFWKPVASSLPGTYTVIVTVNTGSPNWPVTIVPAGLNTTVVLGPTPVTASPTIVTTTEDWISRTIWTNPNGIGVGGVMSGFKTTYIYTATPSATPVTVIMQNPNPQTITETTTLSGTTMVVTATQTVLSTVTGFIEPANADTGNNSGFLPINGAPSGASSHLSLLCGLFVSTNLFLLL
ncbi:hypothetical protein C8Q75DRAFT_750040 [Abortiporus biennis]|nr:hypothetical protein C8Q75DRAFT_750040 [Abortiporus biennis]